jgi:hypothetical protein
MASCQTGELAHKNFRKALAGNLTQNKSHIFIHFLKYCKQTKQLSRAERENSEKVGNIDDAGVHSDNEAVRAVEQRKFGPNRTRKQCTRVNLVLDVHCFLWLSIGLHLTASSTSGTSRCIMTSY